MDQEKLISFSKGNILALIIAGIGIVLVFLGLIQIFQNSSKNSGLVFEEDKEETSSEIVVDIQGAVIKPGVYTLKSNSRMVDVLSKAGGLSEDADRDWVEKNLNLAKKAQDGVKIYIPRVGEEILSNSSGSSVSESGSGGPVININLASKSELETLSGVGPVTAEKIINGRPYGDTGELLSKKIVGVSVFEKIKDYIAAN
ncbi:MAG: hypothetical protein A3A51_04530 [Candidatus Levybacteria bacterium RIFCSPLOWO2_01_FULL_39_10]|nr:MAG: hypothetical protein A3A51_04530 [Candidatus Levybacteria bacterium RIFCSPLOWO2_01_FULL_39_10]